MCQADQQHFSKFVVLVSSSGVWCSSVLGNKASFVYFSQRLVWEVDVSYTFKLWVAARKGSSAVVLQPD